jgi:hypothetical protein
MIMPMVTSRDTCQIFGREVPQPADFEGGEAMKEAQRIETLHRTAMELAQEADTAPDAARARELFRAAFEKEREAAELLQDRLDLEPTRSVLLRSAASLAVDCHDFPEAERLLEKGLAGKPPADIAEEMRSLRRSIPSREPENRRRAVSG